MRRVERGAELHRCTLKAIAGRHPIRPTVRRRLVQATYARATTRRRGSHRRRGQVPDTPRQVRTDLTTGNGLLRARNGGEYEEGDSEGEKHTRGERRHCWISETHQHYSSAANVLENF